MKYILFITLLFILVVNGGIWAQDDDQVMANCDYDDSLSIKHARKLIKEVNTECAEFELLSLLSDTTLSPNDSVEIYILLGTNVYLKYYYAGNDNSDSVFSLYYNAFMIDTAWAGKTVVSQKRLLNLLNSARIKAVVDRTPKISQGKGSHSILKKWWLYPVVGVVGALIYVISNGDNGARQIPDIPDPPSK